MPQLPFGTRGKLGLSVEISETSEVATVAVSPQLDSSNAAFGWVVTMFLVAVPATVVYSAIASGTWDGAGLAVFSVALAIVSAWSLDRRFYRSHEVVVGRGRVVVRSAGLLGTRTQLDAVTGDVRARLVEPLVGSGLVSVVVFRSSGGRTVRLVGLSAPEASRIVVLINDAGSARAV